MMTRDVTRPVSPPRSARHERGVAGPAPQSRVMDEPARGCENPRWQAASSPSGGLPQGGSGHSMQVRAGGDKQQILRNHFLFRELSEAEMATLLTYAHVARFGANERIFLKDRPAPG